MGNVLSLDAARAARRKANPAEQRAEIRAQYRELLSAFIVQPWETVTAIQRIEFALDALLQLADEDGVEKFFAPDPAENIRTQLEAAVKRWQRLQTG